jgi:FixJ family two-component response regulator
MNNVSECKRIAIVEDDGQFAGTVADMCESLGFQSAIYPSAQELLNVKPEAPFAVIFIDLSMPGMDGFELLKGLAVAHWESPVVLMSGFDYPVLRAAQEAGLGLGVEVLGTLKKPFRFAEIHAMLSQTKAQSMEPPQGGATIQRDDLEEAIADDILEVYMQPQVALEDGRWTGMEALVRWPHPTLGWLLPDSFIPLAEESGLALALTRSVAQKAMRIAKAAKERCGFSGSISVNVAPSSLTDEQFPTSWKAWCVLPVGSQTNCASK